MAEFRNVLADGDLIRERQGALGWWLFGEKKWQPYRNLSREVRYLEERMHAAHAAYKAAQDDYVVAHKNVTSDMDVLRMHKMDNSEVSYEIPSDESILARRDGVKYSSSNPNQNQKQKGQGGNGNNQQGGGQKGDGSGDNHNRNNNGNQNKQQGKTTTVRDLLGAKVILH